MKQLLSWCGRRALTPAAPTGDKEFNARSIGSSSSSRKEKRMGDVHGWIRTGHLHDDHQENRSFSTVDTTAGDSGLRALCES